MSRGWSYEVKPIGSWASMISLLANGEKIGLLYGLDKTAEKNARLIVAAPEMYDELYEALQLCEGTSSWDGDEFSKQAKSIRELLERIDVKEEITAHEGTD